MFNFGKNINEDEKIFAYLGIDKQIFYSKKFDLCILL